MTPVPANLLPRPNRAGRARQALEAALRDAEDNGERIPCRAVEEPLWLSEDPGEQAAAVTACLDCPLVGQCAAYAIDAAEPACVYGATSPTGRELSARAAARAARRHPSNTKEK